MRKNLLIVCSIAASALFLLSACSKEIKNIPASGQADSDVKTFDSREKSDCQLVKLDFGDGYYYKFHYNQKGLADEWKIANGDGTYTHYSMAYDANNRLSKSAALFPSGNKYSIEFQYENGKIAKQIWYEEPSHIVVDKVFITYDKYGYILKEESPLQNLYTHFKNTPLGVSRIDFYIDNTLYFTNQVTYCEPNRNPYLAVQGVPFGFPYYELTFSKWWETSEKITMYDNNVPVVVLDYAPYKTIMYKNAQHYPTSVTNYDRITKSWTTTTFDYQNCSGDDDEEALQPSTKTPASGGTVNRWRNLLLRNPAQNIKEKIKGLRSSRDK